MSETQPVEITKEAVDAVCRLAVVITVDDAVALVNEFKKMDTLMPILDPTAYKSVLPNIGGHEDAARAFLTFRLALEKLNK